MRGKVCSLPACLYASRITPAYAGKRCSYAYKATQNEDHPRLCGEKSEKELIAKTAEGSPPPMRGKGPRKKSEGFTV